MKITQYFKFAGIIALAVFAFACGDDSSSSPTPVVPPKVTTLSPSSGPAGTLVTAAGASLEGLDSVKIGKVRIALLSTTTNGFTFNVPSNAVTGKLYVYKGKLADSSQTFTVNSSKGTSISPTTAAINTLVTVTGTLLSNLDSVKVGPEKVTFMNNTETSFTFNVTATTFTGKVYIYKGVNIDSSLTLTVTEPTGSVASSTLTCLINGKTYTANPTFTTETFSGVELYDIIGQTNPQLVAFFIPKDLQLNVTYGASELYEFYYTQSIFGGDEFIADGQNGTTGGFKVTELSSRNYFRGTFSFTAKDENGRVVKITNGRLALRLR